MPKHFVDLYKASLDKKRKKIESHATTLEEDTTDVQNANPPIDIKNVDVSYFLVKLDIELVVELLVLKTITS